MKNRDYVVVLFLPSDVSATRQAICKFKKTKSGGHAGENETSMIYYINPALVDAGAAKSESGADKARLAALPFGYTGIWWYAQYPNHYAGDGSQYSMELGELHINSEAAQLAILIKHLKTDNSPRPSSLHPDFFILSSRFFSSASILEVADRVILILRRIISSQISSPYFLSVVKESQRNKKFRISNFSVHSSISPITLLTERLLENLR